MSISAFKATGLAALERVCRTGQPLLVTKRGIPVAQVLPPPPLDPADGSAFGCMAEGTTEFGDVLEPLPAQDWEALS